MVFKLLVLLCIYLCDAFILLELIVGILFMQKGTYLLEKEREKKKCEYSFFFLKKKVEFNLYLQDTARYEIPHRNKKPICMTNGMEN